MSSLGLRILTLAGISLAFFGVTVIVLIRLVPGPHTSRDYMIIGCVSTLMALFAVFVLLISTSMKNSKVFYKRRKR
ncbi:MAG: hypothetical protein ABIZ80_24470 [Bryobacteraceae bacterium]